MEQTQPPVEAPAQSHPSVHQDDNMSHSSARSRIRRGNEAPKNQPGNGYGKPESIPQLRDQLGQGEYPYSARYQYIPQEYANFKAPLDTFDKSNLFQQQQIQNKVQERQRRQEMLLDQMEKGTKITGKDKFITNKGREVNYFHGNRENFHAKRVQDKYDKVSKLNENYVDKKIGHDNYYKNYIDNAKPVSLEQIEKEKMADIDKKYADENKYYNALNSQVERNNIIRNKFEEEYKNRMDLDKKRADEKYNKEQGEKEAKRIQRKKDFCDLNSKMIVNKKETMKAQRDNEINFENAVNENVARQMDFMEENEYKKIIDNKNYYKNALDNQMKYQREKQQRNYDIEHGNFK